MADGYYSSVPGVAQPLCLFSQAASRYGNIHHLVCGHILHILSPLSLCFVAGSCLWTCLSHGL